MMVRSSWLSAHAVGLWLLASAFGAFIGNSSLYAQGAAPSDDEKAVRASIDSYVAAYNQGDANAVADHFSENAEFRPEQGHVVRGRKDIREGFETVFRHNKGAKLSVTVESLRFVRPDIVVEEGVGKVIHPASGDTPARTENGHYSVVHIKRGNRWLIQNVVETGEIGAESESPLEQFRWLIGVWSSEGTDSATLSSCDWLFEGQYLARDYSTHSKKQELTSGMQIIGWDPVRKQVISWEYDSQGGQSQSVWTKDGNKWSIRSEGRLGDGQKITAVNVVTVINRDAFSWQSTQRKLNDAALPDTPVVEIVRLPGG